MASGRIKSGQSDCRSIRCVSSRVGLYFSNKLFLKNYKNKSIETFLERMNKINQKNELHIMSLVNILPILTVLSMTKILYSNEFMMKMSSMLITHYQNACNYKFTTSERDRSPNINGSIFLPLHLNTLSLFFFLFFLSLSSYLPSLFLSVLVELKFLAFSNSKCYFIYFNTSHYNSPNINGSIFFTTSFKYYFFILFLLFLSLSSCLSLLFLPTSME